MSDTTTARGPMEQWSLDACMHVTETAGLLSWWVPWGALREKARQQDALLADAVAALKAHMVGEYMEGKTPVHHTSNCGYWKTRDETACWYSCKLTTAVLARIEAARSTTEDA